MVSNCGGVRTRTAAGRNCGAPLLLSIRLLCPCYIGFAFCSSFFWHSNQRLSPIKTSSSVLLTTFESDLTSRRTMLCRVTMLRSSFPYSVQNVYCQFAEDSFILPTKKEYHTRSSTFALSVSLGSRKEFNSWISQHIPSVFFRAMGMEELQNSSSSFLTLIIELMQDKGDAN